MNNEDNNYTVYIHTFPNGKRYVGLTKQEVDARWQNGKGYKGQPVFKAICNLGWDNIQHEVINGLTREEAQKKEKELIELYDTVNNGYNVAPGGGCGGNPWIEYEYNGKKYSPDELAKLSPVDGLTGHDITNRINCHGHTIDEALSLPLIHKNQLIEYNGGFYTANQLAAMSPHKDITGAVINNRISKGWDVERAIFQPKDVKLQPFGVGTLTFHYNGKELNSYELWQMRKVEDLSSFDIVNRISHHGWDVERAISVPKKGHNVLYNYNGHQYTSRELAALYPENKLSHNNITDRIRNGWSVKDAVETPCKKK